MQADKPTERHTSVLLNLGKWIPTTHNEVAKTIEKNQNWLLELTLQ